jgi:hypothetical protein
MRKPTLTKQDLAKARAFRMLVEKTKEDRIAADLVSAELTPVAKQALERALETIRQATVKPKPKVKRKRKQAKKRR